MVAVAAGGAGAAEPAGMPGLATYLSVVLGGSDHRRR